MNQIEHIREDTRARIFGDVVIGPNCQISDTAIIFGPCKIGSGVKISNYVIIGEDAEHRQEATDDQQCIEIGDETFLREHVVVQRGLKSGRGTTIGARCYIMHGAHVAHDCRVGDGVTLSPYVVLGGHTTVLDGANLGINSATHQFVTVGACAMVGMGSVVIHDVPTMAKVAGVPARMIGLNHVGLQRSGISSEALGKLMQSFLELAKRPGMKHK